MRYINTFLFCFLLVPMLCNAQESRYTKDIADYLDSNATMMRYDYAYDELLTMLGTNFPKNDKNAQGWKYLEDNKEKALEEMKNRLIPIYKANFTHDEIKQMAAFYSSETGLQLINDRSKLTEAHKEELSTFYNSTTGQKIVSKQEVLSNEISMASEGWTRDLYETSFSLLSNE
ncbi:MAG: DUF2059 domain-containing protein [Maribacter sp.]|nr:DUF2059 domain-containing protein [Maribacter sp.]